MTDSNVICSTITKQPKSKDEFLKSFTSRKLRKNAKKKIAQLLAYADTVTLETQSMGMDDCFRHNEPVSMPKSDFWAWYEREYSDMVIMLTVQDGVLTCAKFSFSLEKEEVEEENSKVEKLMFTFAQVTEGLEQGYISPLNHDQKHPEPTPPTDETKTRKVSSLGDYQERIESKKDRLEARAEKAQAQSNTRFETAHQLGNVLPFGQPILVGHHSERKHRRLIENIDNNMRKSIEAQDKANYLEAKAASVGSAGIASDDPEAIQKLKDKLANLERSQEMMKAINKVIRSKHMSNTDKVEYMIQTHKLTEKHAAELLEGDFCGRVGFPSYALQNNNATIRTTKQRIEELEKLHNEAPLDDAGEVEGVNWTLYEEDGRIKFSFDGIPSEAVRKVLKSNGFKWSRYSKAWVRKMTGNAVRVTQFVVEGLKEM
ncbi:Domain of unknown function (DUF3560) (plasmid) [Vibrio sp. B1ASS3]|uniref:DUF3560 domain-containing protein n=1 Tax=Vibrio sp. B1ASS3 TaxID=2751176 RepID=UPI001AF311DC|nr:DUF3560 domain-containing protein [Vibrio sp. B1ASS3]CAD7828354.1 Domain of unknown function (DUF3560) [Vibrio sp. B1ASS3]CAE6969818.1 Domain of unknown function (DUF3560) [Vibrio sp. B1ASS3]